MRRSDCQIHPVEKVRLYRRGPIAAMEGVAVNSDIVELKAKFETDEVFRPLLLFGLRPIALGAQHKDSRAAPTWQAKTPELLRVVFVLERTLNWKGFIEEASCVCKS